MRQGFRKLIRKSLKPTFSVWTILFLLLQIISGVLAPVSFTWKSDFQVAEAATPSWAGSYGSWAYRKPIPVSGSAAWGGAQTNYQVPVNPSVEEVFDKTGLVGDWNFDEGGGTVASDKSGNNNHGTMNGSSYWTSSGKFNSGFSGNGSSNYTSVPTISIANNVTIEAWVYSSNFAQTGSVSVKGDANSSDGWGFYFDGATNGLTLDGTGHVTTCRTGTWLPANSQWHHLVGIISGTSGSIYVDGVLRANGAVNAIGNTSAIVRIGAQWLSGAIFYPFNGSIDEVKIWNRALTADEIYKHYVGYANNSLVGSWHFSEGSGTNATDSSGQGNNGTITGATWAADKYGTANKALSFNGSSNYVSVASSNAPTGNNARTMEAWFNTTRSTSNEAILAWGSEANTQASYMLVVSGKLYFGGYANPGDVDASGTINVADGAWHHGVIVYDGDIVYLYVDGRLDTSKNIVNLNTTGTAIGIGKRPQATDYFLGTIDEPKIYNRALTASEIAERYRNSSKMRDDYGDLRFTNATGTALDYWQETDSKVWVEADSIPNTAAGTTIYQYYGNASQGSASNYTSTFPVLGTGSDGDINLSPGSSTTYNLNTTTNWPGSPTYAPGVNFSVTENRAANTNQIIITTAANGLSNGDEILIINLQGTSGDYSNVGKYEFARISSMSGTGPTTLTLDRYLKNSYNGTTQKIMVQRVPNWGNVTIGANAIVTANAFDGTVGGLIAFRSSGTVAIAGKVLGDYLGQNGGASVKAICCWAGATYSYQGNSYPGNGTQTTAANGGAGGGGNSANQNAVGGGAGAGYANAGTSGGAGNCGAGGGTGGSISGDSALSKLYLGSGGGAGNGSDTAFGGAGGRGGGIIMISGNSISNGGSGISNNAAAGGNAAGGGGGGGGAGGSVYLIGNTVVLGTNIITVNAGSAGTAGPVGGGCTAGAGGAGSVGRIRADFYSSLSGSSSPSSYSTNTGNAIQDRKYISPEPTVGTTGAEQGDILDYTYKKNITFKTDSPISVSTNQNNFPVAVHISTSSWPTQSERDLFFDSNTGGKRILFFDSDETTSLPYEVEYFSNVQGSEEAIYWVKVPQVDGNSSTDSIYVAYGNDPNGADQDNKTGVWDGNFLLVYHMLESSTPAYDSTLNGYNGTWNSGISQSSGEVKNGYLFAAGDNNYVYKSSTSALNPLNITISTWFKTSKNYQYIASKTEDNLYFATGVGSSHKLGIYIYGLTSESWLESTTSVDDNSWRFGAGTWDGSYKRIYVNGTQENYASKSGSPNSGTSNFLVGDRPGVTGGEFSGSMDEFRYSNTARSADWIKLEYFSMKKTNYNGDNDGTNKFITFGTQTSTIPNSTPDAPTSLAQYKSDCSTSISTGGWTNETSVCLKGYINDTDTNDQVKMQTESTTGSFTGTPNTTASAYCTDPCTSSVSVTGLSNGSQYRWQGRSIDDDSATSGFTQFNSGNLSFGVDTSTPNIVAVDAGPSSGDRTSLTSNTWFKYSDTGSDDQISFSWTDPNSASNDTFYYELNSNSGNTIDGTESNTTNPYIDNIDISASEGTNYFHVRPRNGASTWGTERIFTVKYDKSGPTNVAITGITSDSTTQLTVTSDTATDVYSGLHATPYYFENTTASTNSGWQAGTSWTSTTLSPNTQYTFRVKSKDALENESGWSATTSKYTLASQVSGLSAADATTKSNYKINLSWTNQGQSGIKIEQDTNCDGYETTAYDNASSTPATPYAINVSANTCYQFRISSYNGNGVLNSVSIPETSQITTPPAQPQGLSHTGNTNNSIDWNWNDVSGATGYKVYDATDDSLLTTINTATSQWTQNSLNSNTQYSVYVRATNANGEGIASTSASAYTSADTPTNADHTLNTADSITWSWASGGSEKDFYAWCEDPADNSGWIVTTTWLQNSLSANELYEFFVKARNEEDDETGSASASHYTSQNEPTGISFDDVANDSITLSADGTFPNLSADSSGLYFENATASQNSGWLKTNSWVNSSLDPNTEYSYRVRARNGDSDNTSYTAEEQQYTLANVPGVPTVDNPTINTLHLTINQNLNPAGTEFAIYETSTSRYVDQADGSLDQVSEDWDTYANWGGAGGITITGLAENTTYTFRVKARNADSIETALSAGASGTTVNSPNPPTLVSPAGGSYTADTTPTLSAHYSDPDAGDTGTTNYRIASTSAADCLNNLNIVSSGTSVETTTNDEDTAFTPGASIGSDAEYFWCAQNDDGTNTSSWTTIGSFTLDTEAPTGTTLG